MALGLVLAELGLCFSTISEGRFLYFFLQQGMRFLRHRQCHRYPITRFLLFFSASSRSVKANSGGEGEGSVAYESLHYEEFIVSDSARNSLLHCVWSDKPANAQEAETDKCHEHAHSHDYYCGGTV